MDILDKYDLISKRHSGLLEVGDDPFAVRMERVLSATEALVNGRPTILAGTNNYLGLTFDPDLFPDAWDLADAIPAALEELEAAIRPPLRSLRADPSSADREASVRQQGG